MQILALYVLTYNAPKHFTYWCWCEAFVATYPAVFEQCKKYVINNSDDLAGRNRFYYNKVQFFQNKIPKL